jgi:hypothetical protein
MDIQIIAGVATIIASMYGMLKFMLKDVHKEVALLEKKHEKFDEEMKLIHKRIDAMSNRMDGVYRLILDRTYGKNIPEELK